MEHHHKKLDQKNGDNLELHPLRSKKALKIDLLPVIPHPATYGSWIQQYKFIYLKSSSVFSFGLSMKENKLLDKKTKKITLKFALYDGNGLQVFRQLERENRFAAYFIKEYLLKVKKTFVLE